MKIIAALFTLTLILSCTTYDKRIEKKRITNMSLHKLEVSNPVTGENKTLSVQFADYVLKTWPDPISISRKGWEYTNSIILHGVEEVYHKTGDPRYLDYIEKWTEYFIDDKGSVRFKKADNNLDHLHPGILLLFLYEQTGDKKYKLAADSIREEFNNQPRNSFGGYWHKQHYEYEMWLDGIYMAEPFLAEYGSLFRDGKYAWTEASKQLLLMADHAQDPSSGLLYHGWDENRNAQWADKDTGLSGYFWSRGMGWYTMALVDVLEFIPPGYKRRGEIINVLTRVADGLRKTQDPETGLWFQVMDSPDKPGNFIETSGSGMFIYSLKKAIDNGYIGNEYEDVVKKGWAGLKSKVIYNEAGSPVITDAVQGMGVQATYESYISKEKLQNSPHGLCSIMLAASAMEY